MNKIEFEGYAFIFPDDMTPIYKRYGVDVIWVNLVEGSIMGIGPSDKDWREIPADTEATKIVAIRGKDS